MPLSQGKKIFFVTLLVVMGLSALVLNIFRLRRTLAIAPPQTEKQVSASTTTPYDALKQRDTDGDGLSDYDELFRYGTSPYLKDTDSDGIPDNVEIQNGTNPLCPEGKSCTQDVLSSGKSPAPSATNPLDLLPGLQALTQGAVTNPTTSSSSPEVVTSILSGTATAQDVRAFLKSQGASDADLAKIDDATLLSLYKDSLNQIANPPPPAQTPPARAP